MGLLGGTFEDGAFAIYVVPDPSDMVSHYLLNMISPILFVVYLTLLTIQASQIHAFILLVKLPHPILRIELEETSCWSFDWANRELIAIGMTNGTPSCELFVCGF